MNVQRYLTENVSKDSDPIEVEEVVDGAILRLETPYPNFRTIHPEYVKGPMKYAPKYAPCKPPALAAVMLRAV